MMYWLVVVAAGVVWMVATRNDAPEPAAAVRPHSHPMTSDERWNEATGTQRVALVAMAFGKIVWIGLVLVILAAVMIGTATWMY
ncbi:MAG: hypothetical protein WBN71_03765 [Acidimicrobiia bacterium]|jgi:hypothetical protein